MWDDEKRMSFIEHLGELRSRIIKSLVGLFIAVLICYIFSNQIFDLLAAPLLAKDRPIRVLFLGSAPDELQGLAGYLDETQYKVEVVDPDTLINSVDATPQVNESPINEAPRESAPTAEPASPPVSDHPLASLIPLLSEGNFDIILSQDRFESVTAVELMSLLSEIDLNPAVLVLASPNDLSVVWKAREAGADDYLTRPLNGITLNQAVEYIAKKRGILKGQLAPPWVALNPLEGVLTKVKLAFAGGLLIAFPYILWHICGFIFPGLHKNERNVVQIGIVGCAVLATVGVAFAYFGIIPVVLPFIMQWMPENVQQQFQLGTTIIIIIKALLVFAIVFQFPMAVLILVYLGLLTPESLRTHRRYSIVGLAFVSAIFTPPDPQTMILMMIPMLFLYEVSIWLSYLVVWKKSRKSAEQEA